MVRAALSARRALETLNFLIVNPRGSYTLSELSSALDISPASMSAVLNALTELGYLVRHPRHKTYELGPALVTAGHAASVRHPVIELARPEMRRLSAQGGECVGSVVVGEELLLVALEGRPTGRSHDVWVGQRMPLVPPFGQVFLAWSPKADIERWLDRLGPVTHEQVHQHLQLSLAQVRRRGYSIGVGADSEQKVAELVDDIARRPRDTGLRQQLRDQILTYDDEYSLLDTDPDRQYDLTNLAAPVFDSNGRVNFALTLVGLGSATGAEITRMADDLTGAARLLTRQTGGRPPGNVGTANIA